MNSYFVHTKNIKNLKNFKKFINIIGTWLSKHFYDLSEV